MPCIANNQPTVYTVEDTLAHSDPCWYRELGLPQDSPLGTQPRTTEEVTYEGWHHVNNVRKKQKNFEGCHISWVK